MEARNVDIQQTTDRVREKHVLVQQMRNEISKVIVGQGALIDRLLMGLFTRGHILIEGVPGLAKTSAVKALAQTIHADFKRIQFTPDLLPADILGTEVYRPATGDFVVKTGPIFNNIILADEINRAPSKVQSALLEAMQEHQVTIGDKTYRLGDPFLVLATQNPIEQEGTYPLPEAQVDRFMFKVLVDYPSPTEERDIMKRAEAVEGMQVPAVVNPEELKEMRTLISGIYLDEKLFDYIVNLVNATRRPKEYGLDIESYIEYGASPRASIYLGVASRAYAFLQGRAYVTPQDIKSIAPDVLRHRIILGYEAEAEDITSEEIIGRVFDSVEVP